MPEKKGNTSSSTDGERDGGKNHRWHESFGSLGTPQSAFKQGFGQRGTSPPLPPGFRISLNHTGWSSQSSWANCLQSRKLARASRGGIILVCSLC